MSPIVFILILAVVVGVILFSMKKKERIHEQVEQIKDSVQKSVQESISSVQEKITDVGQIFGYTGSEVVKKDVPPATDPGKKYSGGVIPPEDARMQDMDYPSYKAYIDKWGHFPSAEVVEQKINVVNPSPQVVGPQVDPYGGEDPRIATWISGYRYQYKKDPTPEEVAEIRAKLKANHDASMERERNKDVPGVGFKVLSKAEVDATLSDFDAKQNPADKWKNLTVAEFEALQNRGYTYQSITFNINKANGQGGFGRDYQ